MTAAKMKLTGVTGLIVDNDRFGVTVLTQMLRGMGLDAVTVVETGAAAQALFENHVYDLCLCEAELPDMTGADLVRWIRRQRTQSRYTPLLVLTGYSNLSTVTALRDSGAHLVMRKPVSPQILFDHIAWAAKPPRPFIETDEYVGPDRRFKSLGPPGGGEGRRETDLSADVGEATEPNMSQAEIDAMIRPTRIMAA
jgi:CheY-like chemotaxis protein